MNKNYKILVVIVAAFALLACGGAVYAQTKQTEKVVERAGHSGAVYTFEHNGNRCYVVESRAMNDSHSISCVRFAK